MIFHSLCDATAMHSASPTLTESISHCTSNKAEPCRHFSYLENIWMNINVNKYFSSTWAYCCWGLSCANLKYEFLTIEDSSSALSITQMKNNVIVLITFDPFFGPDGNTGSTLWMHDVHYSCKFNYILMKVCLTSHLIEKKINSFCMSALFGRYSWRSEHPHFLWPVSLYYIRRYRYCEIWKRKKKVRNSEHIHCLRTALNMTTAEPAARS